MRALIFFATYSLAIVLGSGGGAVTVVCAASDTRSAKTAGSCTPQSALDYDADQVLAALEQHRVARLDARHAPRMARSHSMPANVYFAEVGLVSHLSLTQRAEIELANAPAKVPLPASLALLGPSIFAVGFASWLGAGQKRRRRRLRRSRALGDPVHARFGWVRRTDGTAG